jgi:hypothetical protein
MTNLNNNNKKALLVSILNFILFILMITINALANILPINGKNTGEISQAYANLFVPSGITFSIWIIIYILLFFYVLYNFFVVIFDKNENILNPTTNTIFGFSCIFNFLWILSWHYGFIGFSVLIMIFLLVSLIYLYSKIDKLEIKGFLGKLAIKIPISIYLGWISVATIANVAAFLVSVKWNGFGIAENIWAIIMIIIGGFLTTLMLILKKDLYYALVVLWAYSGIIIKRNSAEIIYKDIIYTTYSMMALICLVIIFVAIKNIVLIKK